MAFCCCKKSKQVEQNERKDVQISLLNAKEEIDHATPDDTTHEPMVKIQMTGVVDIGGKCAIGVAKLPGRIYILCRNPSSIVIHRDESPFDHTGEVRLDDLEAPWDLASSKKSECLYMTDRRSKRIFKMTSPSHEVTRWLEDVDFPHTLTVTDPDDQVLLVRYGSPSSLVIYKSDAEEVRQIKLPDEIEYPKHAVRSSAGNYAVSGKVKGSAMWGVFEVSLDGEILRRLTQLGSHYTESYYLAVDSADRLLVADTLVERVLIIDAELSRSQELLTKDSTELRRPWRLHYVTSDSQLLILQRDGKVWKDEGRGEDAAEENTTKVGEATTEGEKTKNDGEKETDKETAEENKKGKAEEEEEKATPTDKKTENVVQTATVNEKEIEIIEEDDKKSEEEEKEEKKEEESGKEEKTSQAVVYIYSYL